MKLSCTVYFFVLLFACSSVQAAFAQEKRILTVDEAVSCALETHVDIQRSAIKLKQSQREYNHSWNKALPSVSVTGSLAEKQAWKDSDSDVVSAQVGASASLSVDAGIASAIKALKSSYEAGKISFDDTVRKHGICRAEAVLSSFVFAGKP